MADVIDGLIAALPLTSILQIAGAFGVLMIIFQMQTVSQLTVERRQGRPIVYWMTRITMALKALALAWCVDYPYRAGISPAPPLVGFVLAFDLYLLVRIYAMHSELSYLKRRHAELA
jgi:hypothetical protein